MRLAVGEEGLENAMENAGRDAGTVIFELQDHLIRLPLRADRKRARAFDRLTRIRGDVQNRSHHAVRIQSDGAAVPELDVETYLAVLELGLQ